MLKVLGIDPGKSGAMAVLKSSRNKVSVEVIEECGDDPLVLLKLIGNYKPNLILLEKQQAMTKQGVSSTFTTGRNFGLFEGVVICSGIKYGLVHPKTWMNKIHSQNNIDIIKELEDKNIKHTKKVNISICQSLFPSISLVTDKGRWKDGVADAILISLYGINLWKEDGIL